jgi:hypothetical protein
MMRTFILGALAAAAIGFAAPAQASMANPGLGAAASGNVEQAQYYYGPRRGYYGRGYYGHRRGYYRGYAFAPRCWTQRVVRWDGRVRYVRRCG